jgi:flavin-dependent dehydrogenase
VVAKEAEFHLTADRGAIDGGAPELFFCRDLEGYGWCVRKGNYLNVGIGRRTPDAFNEHVREFTAFIRRRHQIDEIPGARWRGHAYLAAGVGPRRLVADGMLLVGDAAGLAYPESGEGIKPAIDSGRRAAQVLIGAGGRTDEAALAAYADLTRREHPPARPLPPFLQASAAAIGRALLGSAAFTRHVVLNRWFLRT